MYLRSRILPDPPRSLPGRGQHGILGFMPDTLQPDNVPDQKPQPATAPPSAVPHPAETVLYGVHLVDNYRWLRDKEDPAVTAYLEQENAYTDAAMHPLAQLQDRLYDEMLSHIQEADTSVAVPDGDYFYYTRTEQSRQYAIHCRKQGSLAAAEQVILDVNQLAEGKPFMALGTFAVSPDGNLLAYSTDETGFRQYSLHVRDLRTGKTLGDTAERVGSVVWALDSRTLFYTQEDQETKRQFQLFRHHLGRPAAEDVLVYEESDERFSIGVGQTRDRKYLLLESGSHTSGETRYLPAASPEGEWKLIEPRQEQVEYSVGHRGGLFYIRTSDTSRTFRVVTAPVGDQSSSAAGQWREIIAARPDVMIEDIDLFQEFAVVVERFKGLPRMRVMRFDASGAFVPNAASAREIQFPEPAYSAYPHVNREFQASRFRYQYESLVTPSTVYEFDPATGASVLLKQRPVPGGFDRSLYRSERIFAVADDGVEIPVSVVYRADHKGQGTNPLLVTGYGAYGYPLPVAFSSSRLSLLDRGVVLALAHVRGGGDLGEPWHDAGRMLKKMNTFTDFIAATRHLVANGYGAAERVALEGGSAGGLLVGAVLNLAPELFRAAIAHVPFVDVMNTMLDASLPLTVTEYEEWGNPNERQYFDYMLRYSPYDNIGEKQYPAMLVKTSLYDSQVMYWEPAKYVAKLRLLKKGNRRLLLKTNMSAGHGGASGRYDYLHEIAFDYAFLLRELDVEQSADVTSA